MKIQRNNKSFVLRHWLLALVVDMSRVLGNNIISKHSIQHDISRYDSYKCKSQRNNYFIYSTACSVYSLYECSGLYKSDRLYTDANETDALIIEYGSVGLSIKPSEFANQTCFMLDVFLMVKTVQFCRSG